MTLWKRVLNNNLNITIINKCLIYYRIHSNQIGGNNESIKNEHMDRGFKSKPSEENKILGSNKLEITFYYSGRKVEEKLEIEKLKNLLNRI